MNQQTPQTSQNLQILEENGQNHTLQVSGFLQRVEETAHKRDTLITRAYSLGPL